MQAVEYRRSEIPSSTSDGGSKKRVTTTATTSVQCPTCGDRGKPVQPLTVRSLVADEAVGRVADGEYRFCEFKNCETVYFGGGQTFAKSDLKVPVGVKETTGERLLCYCFGHSVASIEDELRTEGRSDAVTDIRRKMKQPGCQCETQNPSGTCCLGTVAKGIETAKAEVSLHRSSGSKAETFTKVGTIVSAVVASSCCWLPLVLLLFGVSGAGIAGAMESYRPLFIVLTFGFLAAAFCFTYRPRRAASTGEDCCATAHDCCSATGTARQRRLSVMGFNKIMLWVVTVLAVAFLFFPSYMGLLLAGRSDAGIAGKGDPLVRQTLVAVEGMHCEGCAVLVEESVEDVPGVLNAKVDYENRQVVISTKACCPFPRDEALAAMQQAGYSARIIESE